MSRAGLHCVVMSLPAEASASVIRSQSSSSPYGASVVFKRNFCDEDLPGSLRAVTGHMRFPSVKCNEISSTNGISIRMPQTAQKLQTSSQSSAQTKTIISITGTTGFVRSRVVRNAVLHCSCSNTEPVPEPRKYKGSLQAVGVLSALLTVGAAAALTFTLRSGGPRALLSTVSRSGFPAAFSLIFVSEIGDKTFFIAALLAMRHNKWLVLLGASGALSVMTVISVVIGRLFRNVPASLQTTLPVGEYAAVALLLWFGLRSIKSAWDLPSTSDGTKNEEPQEMGELAEAEEFLKQVDDKKIRAPLEVLGESFSLIFLAEWGDRSMLATIALGAAQSPWGVASGAIAGHILATLLAVVGGALLARYLSEKMIGYFGGFLFLGFAGATLAGVF